MDNTKLNRTYYITYEGVHAKNSFRTILVKSSNLYELMGVLCHAYCIPKFITYTFKIWTGNWREYAELSEYPHTAKQQIQEFVAEAELTPPKRGE